MEKHCWENRCVMIGALKNREQYDINYEGRFYHIPAALLSVKPEDVQYVAPYRSMRFFSDGTAGIREYARVRRVSVVPRGDITEIPAGNNVQELYCRFDLEDWRRLERPVRAKGLAPGVSMMTTEFLLHSCRFFPELTIRSEEHWQLYTTLKNAAISTHRSGGSRMLPSTEGNTVMVAGGDIGVYTADGRFEQYSMRTFFQTPYEFLQIMRKYVTVIG